MLRRLRLVLEMIRFHHSVFALPFALIGMMLAARGWPPARTFAWIVAACVCARSAAMAFNRLADHALDARNPRTAGRALPAGALTRRFVWVFTLAAVAGFLLSAAMLNRLALALSPVALAVLLGYSYTKRFTNLSHFVLGLALGIAPVGAWIAVRGDLAAAPLVVCLGVLLWTAGFDILYACQDYEHDVRTSLYSIPKALGIPRALAVSSLLHVAAFVAFLAVYFLGSLGYLYLAALAASGALMTWEHWLVKPNDLSRLNTAFFTLNGFVSIGLFLGCALDFAFGFAHAA
ncbi:MAG: putative 4-hydroxybenzoate polyprenyltransferase [Candidatus Sumerlaeota bacterium]|nr:putative 4-hydroxybenzoate polyprenyltransferase [Candidatus Sumerlaeota bacterium]